MGKCFKLFGKAVEEQKVVDSTGSAFFVAEHYLLTCKHLVTALSPGDELSFKYNDTVYDAVLMEIAESWDLALIYTEMSAKEGWVFSLDRVALEGREAIAYGYPHGQGLDEQRGLKIGAEMKNGVAVLTNSNGLTIGFSGGPLCPTEGSGTAIGVISTIKGVDKYNRQQETSGFIPARVALELWGERYSLWEKHYEVRADVFGSNSFVYSALKTDFQDSHNYLSQLRSFVEDYRPILWWTVVGPGGSGKSRLCYELARSLNSNWHCELLSSGQLKKVYLQNLYEEAGRDFLLLADYAYADTNELGVWLDERARVVNAEKRPRIRVLLLQREVGREYFGWQDSLLCGRRNLINLRYKEDLRLSRLSVKETVALMRSYAENMGGGQIDAEELFEVLKSNDPGLTRPLFAMFIVDAVLHGDDPRKWDSETALAYFTRREKDVVDTALKAPQDARAAKLLLALATISNGFTFDMNTLDFSPLHELREFSELPDKGNFGSRLDESRLADWECGRYSVKPLKPDLLGEYYVLDFFQEVMNDYRRKGYISILLCVAKKTDPKAAGDFLTRLFTDYETDEDFAVNCCGEDYWCHFNISWGLVIRPDAELLEKLYKVYETKLWLEQYAKGLVNAIARSTVLTEKNDLLEKLRLLHRNEPGNAEITEMLAKGVFNALKSQTNMENIRTLLDELRMLRKKEPRSAEHSLQLAKGLVYAITKSSVSIEQNTLVEELRSLHKEETGNAEVTGMLATGLYNEFNNEANPVKANTLLGELWLLYNEEPGNAEVSIQLAKCLVNAIAKSTTFTEQNKLLDEFRLLHKELIGNAEITGLFAMGLFNAFVDNTNPNEARALLGELWLLHDEEPGNAEVSIQLAKGLFNTLNAQTDLEIVECLLNKLRTLHKKELENTDVAVEFAMGLVTSINRQTNPDKTVSLLNDLRSLYKEEPGNAEVTKALAKGLHIAFIDQPDTKKAEALLNELRMLHKEIPRNTGVAVEFAMGLFNAFTTQTDPEKAEALLNELRLLHREEPRNNQVVVELSKGLVNAINKFYASMNQKDLLDELRLLRKEESGNADMVGSLAKGLANAIAKPSSLIEQNALLDELRSLHSQEVGNSDVVGAFAGGLFNAFINQINLKNAEVLLDELRSLYRKESGNAEVEKSLAKGLLYSFILQTDSDKAYALLDELLSLNTAVSGKTETVRELSIRLYNTFKNKTDLKKARDLLDEIEKMLLG